MSMPKKSFTVQLPSQTLMVLEILCRKLKRTRDDITLEALSYIFQEYKEAILDTLKKCGLNGKVGLEKVSRKEICLDDYQGKKEVKVITELELAQINVARQVIILDGSHYGQTLKNGGYLFDQLSKWQIFDVKKSELGITRVVLWNELDDGSFSVHFTHNSTEAAFYCFEN